MWRRLELKTRKLETPTKRRILPLKEELKFLEFLAAATGQVANLSCGFSSLTLFPLESPPSTQSLVLFYPIATIFLEKAYFENVDYTLFSAHKKSMQLFCMLNYRLLLKSCL